MINERAQKLLNLLVGCYIREGQPIGSKTLAKELSLTMSSASIRNIMADLEEAGFLNSPHTSAGRIPTALGYRFFVDSLLNAESSVEVGDKSMMSNLRNHATTKGLVAAASSMLSGITKLAGLVMLPCHDFSVLRHIEFLPLSGNRVLVVLVLNKNEVQNRIIYTDRFYKANELQSLGNYLTEQFYGKELYAVRDELLNGIHQDQKNIEELTHAIVDVADKALSEQEHHDYIVAGEANLLNMADHSELNKLRGLFEAFSSKRDILHLLDQCLKAEGVKIYIGEESGYAPFGDCSIVTAPYRENGKVVGVLGVIGPQRMPYGKAIAAVNVTAQLLTEALESLE